MSDSLQRDARLLDADFYASDPHDVYARLRAEAPVFWHEGGQMWALSKYEDVREVMRYPERFSSAFGVRPRETLTADDGSKLEESDMPRRAELRRQRGLGNLVGGEPALPLLDPPRHGLVRKVVGSAFTPRFISSLEATVERLTTEALGAIDPGTTVDFVERVAMPVPLYMVATMLGVDQVDWPDFRRWVHAVISLSDSDFGSGEVSDDMNLWLGEFIELTQYFGEKLDDRLAHPRDDLLTALAQAEIDGEPLDLMTQLMLVVVVLSGAYETTRGLLAGGVRLLAEHPDQQAILVERPEFIPGAVEEFLRYGTPVVNMARTVLEPTSVRGQEMSKGDYLVLLFAAANRDEDIWPQADVFDVTRRPDSTHVAFGVGEHFCLGAALARAEARIVFSQLLTRFPKFQLAGPYERTPSTLTPGYNTLPVSFL